MSCLHISPGERERERERETASLNIHAMAFKNFTSAKMGDYKTDERIRNFRVLGYDICFLALTFLELLLLGDRTTKFHFVCVYGSIYVLVTLVL
jgi:hypothetical protein